MPGLGYRGPAADGCRLHPCASGLPRTALAIPFCYRRTLWRISLAGGGGHGVARPCGGGGRRHKPIVCCCSVVRVQIILADDPILLDWLLHGAFRCVVEASTGSWFCFGHTCEGCSCNVGCQPSQIPKSSMHMVLARIPGISATLIYV
jgi:hypothetical protein